MFTVLLLSYCLYLYLSISILLSLPLSLYLSVTQSVCLSCLHSGHQQSFAISREAMLLSNSHLQPHSSCWWHWFPGFSFFFLPNVPITNWTWMVLQHRLMTFNVILTELQSDCRSPHQIWAAPWSCSLSSWTTTFTSWVCRLSFITRSSAATGKKNIWWLCTGKEKETFRIML